MTERNPDDVPADEPVGDEDGEEEDESSPEDPDYVDGDASGTMQVAPDPALPALTATPAPDVMQVWPHTPPKEGEVYGFFDSNHDAHLIAMTMETWQGIFKDIRVMQGRLAQLSAENIEFRQGRVPDDVPRILLPTDAFRKLVN